MGSERTQAFCMNNVINAVINAVINNTLYAFIHLRI